MLKQLITCKLMSPEQWLSWRRSSIQTGWFRLVDISGFHRLMKMLSTLSYHLTLPISPDLLIRGYHPSFMHGGPKLVLSLIYWQYWISSSRDTIRRFMHSCVICKRPKPVMADLPVFRVQSHHPNAYTHVGMDYEDPYTIKEHRRSNSHMVKVYLPLFVWISVKAVHLDSSQFHHAFSHCAKA